MDDLPLDFSLSLPGGDTQRISVDSPTEAALPLLDLLSRRGVRLLARCGGLGRCQGCRLHCPDGASFPACRVTVREAALKAREFTVPESSWMDHRLSAVTAFELCGPEIRPVARSGLGLAFDIGTTTLALALWDLDRARCLGIRSASNPQRAYGDDVTTRVTFACAQADAPQVLQRKLIHDGFWPLCRQLLSEADRDLSEVRELIAVGNPIMLHTLAGLPLLGFGAYPFQPVFVAGYSFPASTMDLPEACRILSLPGLGPFVGADITAGALAAGLLEPGFSQTALLIDFGTNGEILLHKGGQFFATATAIGPAFEGGRLNCGATAAPGVITALSLDQDARWQWQLFGYAREDDHLPRGIAGAAYLELVAEGLRHGFITASGRFTPRHPLISEIELEAHSAPQRCLRLTQDVFVTEADIAELLQAKAAVQAGVETLLAEAGSTPAQLDAVIIGGGFGYHLNLSAAQRIGLLPPVPPEKLRVLGNTALGGASRVLLEASWQPEIDALRSCQYIELNLIEEFEDRFIDAMILEAEAHPG